MCSMADFQAVLQLAAGPICSEGRGVVVTYWMALTSTSCKLGDPVMWCGYGERLRSLMLKPADNLIFFVPL